MKLTIDPGLKVESKHDTPFCKTLGGSAKLATAPAIFCLNDHQIHAEGKIAFHKYKTIFK